MEQPQRKTWTMKHPALAKAYAVVFAVMSLILLFGGVSGVEKAEEENAERLRYEKKYAERIENYVDLCARLENSITYDELWAELEERIEEHDEDASQHRTDLAMHTAEKGGYTMGANAIWEAVPDFNDSKRQLAIAKQMLEEQAPMVAQLRDGVAMLTQLETAISTCDGLLKQLVPLTTIEPEEQNKDPLITVSKPDVEDEKTVEENENLGDGNDEKLDTGDDETLDTGDDEKLDTGDDEKLDAGDDEKLDTGDDEKLDTGDDEKLDTGDDESLGDADDNESLGSGDTDESAGAAKLIVDEVPAGEVPGSGDTNIPAQAAKNLRVRYSAQNTHAATIQYIYGVANQLAQGQLPPLPPADIATQATVLSAYIGGIKTGLEEQLKGAEALAGMSLADMRAALKAYDDGVAAIAAGEKGLGEAWGALENIWYELGQLEDEHEELIVTRDILDEEAAKLSKEVMEADALHELENDRTSAKLLLTSVKEVNDMVEAGGEIVPSAEKHLESYKAQTQLQYKGRMLSCALAIVGGVMGVLAIPAAYELIRKRFWLIVPAVLCVVCAAAAEGIYYGVGLGWWYVGMFTAIIGTIHLLIVAPKEKHPNAS